MVLTVNTAATRLEGVLETEAAHLERELEAMPQFRRLKVIQQTLKDLREIGSNQPLFSGNVAPAIPGNPSVAPSSPMQASSIPHAVILALEEAGQPLSTRTLLELIQRYGRSVGGKNPLWGLSNTLSMDSRFQSVPWGDARAWWFAGRPVPAS